MKITKKKLENSIREEIQNILDEQSLDKYKAGFAALMRGENPLKAAAAKEIEGMPIYRSKKGSKHAKAKRGIKQALTSLQKIRKIAQSGQQSEPQMQRTMEKESNRPYGPMHIANNMIQDLINAGLIPKTPELAKHGTTFDKEHPLYVANRKLHATLMNLFKNKGTGKLKMSAEILQGDVSQIKAAEQALMVFQKEVLKYK